MPTLPRPLARPVRGTVARYTVAIAAFLLGLGLREAFNFALPPGLPFLTFFPAIIFATFLAGRGPGILCAALSLLAAWYWFIPPFGQFKIDGQIFTALLFFGLVSAVDIALIDGLQARQERLQENRRRLQEMADHQTLLFKELQHRVANNLASVSSMLRLQRREIERDPSCALDVIDRADQRIELMGRIHRQLYDPAAMSIPVSEHLARVVDQARQVSGRGDIAVRCEADDVHIEISRLMTLSLLVTELVSNSLKHAFAAGQTGEVLVTLRRADDGELRLVVADNGNGMAPPQVGDRKRLGTAIIAGLTTQLGGTSETASDAGVRTEIGFRS